MAWSFVLDGVDVTGISFEKSWNRRLNRPSMGKCKIPGHLASGAPGTSRLKIYDTGSLKFHGVVWRMDDSGQENDTWTEYTAFDPMIYWNMKPVRDDEGVIFPDILDNTYETIFEEYETAPQIFSQIIQNSITHEGSMGIAIGGVSFGGVDVHARPTDWPLTVEDARRLLTETGELDIVMVPIETGSDMARMDLYNGDYGSNLSGSVQFQYQTGAHNVQEMRRSQDMTTVCNVLWYLGGPKSPDGQHFCWGITIDDPCLDVYGDFAALEAQILASRAAYGELMELRVFDSLGTTNADCEDFNDPIPGVCTAPVKDPRRLYWRHWMNESLVRSVPRTLVTATPIKGIAPAFDAGDLVSVQAGSRLRGGFSGTQRVYEFTVNIDNEGIPELAQLVTSADQG